LEVAWAICLFRFLKAECGEMGRWPQYAVAVVLAMKVLADKDRIVSLPAYTFLELPQASGRVWDFVYFLATSRAAKLDLCSMAFVLGSW